MRVLPHDRWKCGGCGQLLVFDADALVADEQLRGCQSRCRWELVERAADGGEPDAAPPASSPGNCGPPR